MAATLVSCSSCARHIRRSETACPFCGEVVQAVAFTPSSAGRPLTRAAILLASAAAVAGCGKEPKTTEGTTDAGLMIAAPYGVPMPFDAEPPPPEPTDAGHMIVNPYGVPMPSDAGQMAAPAYGVAPPPAMRDAGKKK